MKLDFHKKSIAYWSHRIRWHYQDLRHQDNCRCHWW